MNYSPLRINTIKAERQITFHLYVHFKDQYLLYFQPGDAIPKDKFKKLKKQKIAKFYIPAAEEGKYQNFIDALLSEVVKSTDTPLEEKVSIVEAAAETAVEQIQTDPGSQAAYKLTQSAATGLRELVKENPEALKTMFEKKPLPQEELIKHSLNVCMLATKLAEILRFNESQIQSIMIAALMHDIGVAKCEEKAKALFKKSKQEFTPDDRISHKEHIEVTLKLLNEKPWISPQIIDLIKHHEEVMTGAGPFKKTKLSPEEECLSLVNTYDKKIQINNLTPKQALKELMVDEIGNYELKTINKFKTVLEQQGLAV